MTHWKVIALISGSIEAVSGPSAEDRPGAHEWVVWQGTAGGKAEALQSAEKVDPRVDLEWMRIRYEHDLNSKVGSRLSRVMCANLRLPQVKVAMYLLLVCENQSMRYWRQIMKWSLKVNRIASTASGRREGLGVIAFI